MIVSLDNNNSNIQAEKTAASQGIKDVPKNTGSVSGVSVDLFVSGNDNDAYKGAPKTQKDIEADATMMDVKTNSDYRIVMSNCMSDEDFSRLLEEGTHPGNTDIETVVTIVDTIKAEMAKSGNMVAGYNDDLDKETLKEITGNEAFANKIASSFDKKDIPLTKENVEMAKDIYDRVSEMGSVSEDAKKYLVENNLEPTADNLYKAVFSVKTGNSRQSKGYFANDMQGYYSQKAEVFNWANLQPQMEKVIENAGYQVTDDTLMDSMWIIKNGIPFTEDSFDIFEKIKNVNLVQEDNSIMDAIATAIADGKPAKEAVFSNTTTMMEKAVMSYEALNDVTNQAVDLCVENNQTLNIRNLSYWQTQINANVNLGKTVSESMSQALTQEKAKGYLALEEARLQMSVEANYRLLKSGYQIDVADLTDLVMNLKDANAQRAQVLFGEGDEIVLNAKQSLFNETVEKVGRIPELPATTVAMFTARLHEFTLNNVYETGTALLESYKKANRSYETMMTTVRPDLGDSIKKAFRNVDDILADMEYAINEENRKAVRTLGYNNIPLTDENIEKVIDANRQVGNVLDKLTPAAIMKMIREGQNPLEMQMKEVEQYLIDNAASLDGSEGEKFSSYLYQLEQNHEISDAEREAYIGVCRLLHQINKSDGGAVGSLLGSKAEINFKNLLTAVRSKNKGHINMVLDENTGVFEGNMEHFHSISAQIERAFANQMKSLKGYEETAVKYEKEMLSDIQNLNRVSDNIISHLLQNELPVTADNLFAANALMNMEYQVFGKIAKRLKDADANQEFSEFEKACEDFRDTFDSEEKAGKGVMDFTKKVQELLTSDTLENEAKAIDIKELNLLHKQIGMVRNFASNREYQVPVYLNGEFTTIHLTLVRDDGEMGTVNVSMETKEYGTIGGKFTQNEGFVEGYLACENGFDTQTKEMFTNSFAKGLSEANLQGRRLSFVKSQDVKPEKFGSEGAGKQIRSEKADTKTLYAVAKVFIQSVQEAM